MKCELNYHDQKIRRTPIYRKTTLLGIISSVYRYLHYWRSNQRPQIALPKLFNWGTCSYHTLVKEYGCNLQDIFRLFGRTITMTCWFGVICVWYDLVALWESIGTAVWWRWFDLQWRRLRYTLLMRRNNVETLFPYIVRRCSADFLVIQFTILIPLLKK